MNPFTHDAYFQWRNFLEENDASVTAVIFKHDGTIEAVGNLDLAIENLKDAKRKMIVQSRSWIPEHDSFGSCVSKQELVKKEAPIILRQFMAAGQAYGTGHCPMWEEKVQVAKLPYSINMLKNNNWNNEMVAIADVLEWSGFKKSFGSKPKAESFKMKKCGLRELMVIIIEVGYTLMDIETNYHLPIANDNNF